MSRSPLVAAGLAATAIAVAGVLLHGPGPGGSPSVGPGVPEPGSASVASPDSSGGVTGRTSGRPSPPASSASAGTPGPTSPSSTGASRSSGIEMEPDQDGSSPQPEVSGLPDPGGPTPAGSRSLLTAAPHSVVAQHTRSQQGEVVQVALTASNPDRVDAVLRFYRVHLGRFGFTETSVPAVGGSTAAGFRHGDDSIVVTVTPRSSGGVSYSVFGTLRSSRS